MAVAKMVCEDGSGQNWLRIVSSDGLSYQWGKKSVNVLEPELFFLILAHPVHKMWIIQEPNMLELWNKLHFEEEKNDSIYHV